MRTRHLVGGAVAALALLSLALTSVATAPPAAAGGGTTITVVTTTDDELDHGELVPGADVSLREAVAHSNGGDGSHDFVVQLAPGATYVLDLCDTAPEDGNLTGDLDVNVSMSFTLQGNGATVQQTCDGEAVLWKNTGFSQLVVDDARITGGEHAGVGGMPDVRIQDGSIIEGSSNPVAGGGVVSATDVFIEDSTVQNNVAGTSGGGAWAAATLTVSGSTITGNVAGTGGGGIGSILPITVVRSAITDNDAAGTGGAILALDDLVVATSTIARNRSATVGGGIDNVGSDDPTSVSASTIVANAAPIGANVHTEFNTTISRSIVSLGSGGEDCALDGGGNLPILVGGDESCYGILQPLDELSLHPMLAPSADNGGPTETQRTVSPSRAVDVFGPGMGGCVDGPDQRGVARPQGALCDVGAFEGVPLAVSTSYDDVSIDHPFVVEISWLTQMGITGGFADGGYHPSATVSRQAMAAFLYRLALTPPVDAEQAVATDVPLGHAFLREIHWLVEEGIATGYGDETFRPLAPVTRQAMAAFLYRVAGSPEPFPDPSPQTFDDVPPGHPFFEEIAWMADSGVSTGYDDDTFRPSTSVSRQAMAAFLLRLADEVPLLGL